MDANTTQLKHAFQRAGLWRQGWTFERAMEAHAIRTALTCLVAAEQRRAHHNGQRLPVQPQLF